MIVIISIYEIIEKVFSMSLTNNSNANGVSVLRSFRLLRIIKYIRFMPTMRRQLFVIFKSFNKKRRS